MAEASEQALTPAEPAASAQKALARVAQNAGLGAAMLYAAGALDLAASLQGAGLSAMQVTQVFRLIPIEQHFARSVGLLVSPRGLLLVALLIATSFVLDAALYRREAGQGEPQGIVARLSRAPRPAVVLLVAAYVALLFLRPGALAQQAFSLLILYGLTRLTPGARIALSTRVLAIGFALLVGFVVREYAFPRPLPQAEVVVEGAAPVRGLLAADVDGTLYMVVAPGVMRIVSAHYAVTTRVVTRERRRDWKESTLPGLLGR